jgi:hypothetical protein
MVQVVAHAKKGESVNIELDVDLEDDMAMYVCTSRPGVSVAAGPQYEEKYVVYRLGLCTVLARNLMSTGLVDRYPFPGNQESREQSNVETVAGCQYSRLD